MSQFIGGPYDGLDLSIDQINACCEVMPSPSRERKFIVMPPVEIWEKVVSGAVPKGLVDGKAYAYEVVRVGSDFEYRYSKTGIDD